MPYPNEHAARLVDPGRFDDFRRSSDKFGPGIHAVFGLNGGKSTLQAIRFDAGKFTAARARRWLEDHDYEPIEFAEATGKHGFFRVEAMISKIDEALRIVWGWAYEVEKGGRRSVDYSGELPEHWREVQKCAHGFVKDSRAGGVMHSGRAGHIVDSIFFDPDIQKALGIEVPIGWFIGYKVEDDDAWQGVLSGKYTGFSIHGTALKREITDAEAEALSV